MLEKYADASLTGLFDEEDTFLLKDGGEDEELFRFDEFRSSFLSHVERKCSEAEIRRIGEACIRLADSIDQNWSPESVTNKFRWPSLAARIERRSLELAKKAVLLKEQSRIREQLLPEDLRGESYWMMLLELFIQFAGGAKVSSKSLILVAGRSHATGLRQIERLEGLGLVKRTTSGEDKRVTWVELTKKGAVKVGTILERLPL